jgi:hypothetical protein
VAYTSPREDEKGDSRTHDKLPIDQNVEDVLDQNSGDSNANGARQNGDDDGNDDDDYQSNFEDDDAQVRSPTPDDYADDKFVEGVDGVMDDDDDEYNEVDNDVDVDEDTTRMRQSQKTNTATQQASQIGQGDYTPPSNQEGNGTSQTTQPRKNSTNNPRLDSE